MERSKFRRSRAHASVGAVRLTPLQALRDVIAERCFGPDSPPLHGGDDAREALRDLVS
jgi:hypothetical protein